MSISSAIALCPPFGEMICFRKVPGDDACWYKIPKACNSRPKNISGWEALIRCLFSAGYYPEARQQALAALSHTNNKVIFHYYLSAILFAMNKSKEALLYLDKALSLSPKHLKKFVQLNPSILQNPLVVDVIAQYKRGR